MLSPLKPIYLLCQQMIQLEYTNLKSSVVDMTCKTSKGNSEITRLIKVLVSTIWPLECVLTTSQYLLGLGNMLHYSERFRSPVILDEAFKNIALFKISMDVGGGSTKGIIKST